MNMRVYILCVLIYIGIHALFVRYAATDSTAAAIATATETVKLLQTEPKI
jgi:hypothetical protein